MPGEVAGILKDTAVNLGFHSKHLRFMNRYKNGVPSMSVLQDFKDAAFGLFNKNGLVLSSFDINRDDYIERCGFIIYTSELVDLLTQHLKELSVLEVGSGSGYLSFLLKQKGINIKSVDSGEREFKKIYSRDINGDAIKEISTKYDAILMCWPDYDAPFAYKVASKMLSGQLLFYEGEDEGGCTGTDKFFTYIDEKFTELFEGDCLTNVTPVFTGIHDRWTVLRKK